MVEKKNNRMMTLFNQVAEEGTRDAARGFSGMLGQNIKVSPPSVSLTSLLSLPKFFGGPENEAIAIYLQAEGGIGGQIFLVMPFLQALELSDLLLDVLPGTTHHLGPLEQSALAEAGNVAASYFLNTAARLIGETARPSPPVVIIDMLGAILDVIVAQASDLDEEVLLLRSDFVNRDQSLEVSFWVIPAGEMIKQARETSL